jgi:hypothetical protein
MVEKDESLFSVWGINGSLGIFSSYYIVRGSQDCTLSTINEVDHS